MDLYPPCFETREWYQGHLNLCQKANELISQDATLYFKVVRWGGKKFNSRNYMRTGLATSSEKDSVIHLKGPEHHVARIHVLEKPMSSNLVH